MHRNTLLVVATLAVVAALLIGFNIGQRLSPQSQQVSITEESPDIDAELSPVPTQSIPTTARRTYTNDICGISLTYDASLQALDSASTSAVFNSPSNPNDTVVVTCQDDIVPPDSSEEDVTAITIASTSANIYFEEETADGTRIQSLIFSHPTRDLDVFIAAAEAELETIIDSLEILQ